MWHLTLAIRSSLSSDRQLTGPYADGLGIGSTKENPETRTQMAYFILKMVSRRKKKMRKWRNDKEGRKTIHCGINEPVSEVVWNKVRIILFQSGRFNISPSNSHAPVFEGDPQKLYFPIPGPVYTAKQVHVVPLRFWKPQAERRRTYLGCKSDSTLRKSSWFTVAGELGWPKGVGGGGDKSVSMIHIFAINRQIRGSLSKRTINGTTLFLLLGMEKLAIFLRASSEDHIFPKSLLILGKNIFSLKSVPTGLFQDYEIIC